MPLDHELSDETVTAPAIEKLIVFTDLDGTLLDHETYSHAAALPALKPSEAARDSLDPGVQQDRSGDHSPAGGAGVFPL